MKCDLPLLENPEFCPKDKVGHPRVHVRGMSFQKQPGAGTQPASPPAAFPSQSGEMTVLVLQSLFASGFYGKYGRVTHKKNKSQPTLELRLNNTAERQCRLSTAISNLREPATSSQQHICQKIWEKKQQKHPLTLPSLHERVRLATPNVFIAGVFQIKASWVWMDHPPIAE